jgi:NADPH2:quinone reductase
MKAIRIHQAGAPDVMKLEECPALKPGPGQVVVRVKAAGVNPVDTYIRSGLYPIKRETPYTPGLDAAGVVEAIGDGVGHTRIGDRVYVGGSLSGSYAEQVLCQEAQVHPLPDRISFAQGAALGVPYATAYYALWYRAHALPGDFVLIHGASGGVGIAAVQLARASGMQVIGTAGTEQGIELVKKEGAHHVLNHKEPGYLEQIPKLTCDHGVDVVLEMLANVNLPKDLKILAMRGRVVVIGNRGPVEIDAREAMGKNGAILGMTLFNVTEPESRTVHAALVAGLESGTLNPVVARELPLGEAPASHEAVMAPGAHGKIVLIP